MAENTTEGLDRIIVAVIAEEIPYLKMIHACLKDTFQVVMLDSMQTAIQYLEEQRPDVILADEGNMHLDHITLMKYLKQKYGFCRPSVIRLIEMADKKAAMECGEEERPDKFLLKPVSIQELTECIMTVWRSGKAIQLPEKVKEIIGTITTAGYEAYAVGGCIRDSLLGRSPEDFDITTSASPQEIKELFLHTIDTGIKHGTVTILMQGETYEVTTYRMDGEYEDHRHPKEVVFTASLSEDLKRRDFTMNAMAYNDESGLVDPFGGARDLERKLIRCVGNPMERFTEDALRMMRAVRFSAQLGYAIEENTKNAICAMAPSLCAISAERIQTELIKLITSDHPSFLRIAYETGITAVIMPEFDDCMRTEQHNPHHCYSVGEHTLQAMESVGNDKVLRLTMLFHDMGKPLTKSVDENGIDHFHGHPEVSATLAKDIMHRLKLDNKTIHDVTQLVRYHDLKVKPDKKSVRRMMAKLGTDIFARLFEIKRADILSQSSFQREEKEKELAILFQIYQEICANGECVSLKMLAVTGSDLKEAGIVEGPRIGEELTRLLDLVLEDPAKNTKEYLLSKIKK